MGKLNSSRYSETTGSIGLLVLRLGLGILMLPHGYSKLMTYSEKSDTFMDFLGLGGAISLALLIFAEFFCSILVVLGFFTRLACVPLIIAMTVAVSKNDWNVFGKAELAALYIAGYLCLMLTGPGKWSVDGQLRR